MIFLSAIAVMQVIFWTKDMCSFISCNWNSFNCKLEKLINKQVIFCSPSNAVYSSEEYLKKNFSKHLFFIGMCSLFNWFDLQISNFCFLFNKNTLKLNRNKAGLFEGSFFWGRSIWHLLSFIFQEELIWYQYRFMQLLKYLFRVDWK